MVVKERLATFFENMGWKVYTVPETATVLLSGGTVSGEGGGGLR